MGGGPLIASVRVVRVANLPYLTMFVLGGWTHDASDRQRHICPW
jgi:hypothetical protein